MGVDLALYRARVGQFVPRTVKDVVSNIKYLCKAIASVRSGLTHDKLDIKGAVTFIDLLLRIQGIEPNPGPGKTDQQLFTEEQSEDNNDINNTYDSNDNPVSADRISQVMESFLLVSNPSHTGSSPTNESAGAVAIPGLSSGVPIPTTVNQLTVNYIDKRKYREEINVEHTDNVCSGEQTIIHTETSGKNEDDQKHESKKKTPKRILLEENAETMLNRHIEETNNILVTRTKAEKAVVKCLKDYNMVVISGVTGEGKTTLGREICKKLRDGTLDKRIKRKTPVLITVPQDWSDVVNDKDDIVVFVDDIFGKTNYQTGLLNGWKPFFDRILQSLREGKVCLVVTSRTHILKDARRESGVLIEMVSDHILSEKKTVDLTDDQRLTMEERLSIYKKYSNQREGESDSLLSRLQAIFVVIYSFPSNIPIGFAQICKLFFTNDSFFEKGEEFFRNPHRMLTEEIERMRLTEPHKYFALVYCFLNDQTIDTKELNRLKMPPQDYDTLKIYADVCGVPDTDNVLTRLKNGLDALDRTYMTRQNTLFTISHQSIADSVSLVFGKEYPEMILEKCSNRVILELLDVTEDGQSDMCTLHVPANCFEQLVKRMYKMIMEGGKYNRITLESFARFRNQKLANCLFEYITTQNDREGFLKAHCGSIYFTTNSLLESCANNVPFLRAFFKFKIDDFVVKEYGMLTHTTALQRALQHALEHANLKSLSILLNKGAFLTEKCLQLAIGSNDEKLVKFVLSRNAWADSEVKKHISDNTLDHIRDILKGSSSYCKVNLIRGQCIEQKTYTNTKATELSSMCINDITRAAEEMDFDILHAIFQAPELEEHRYCLINIILESKHKMLTDVIAIKMILGQIDGKIVQHALHNCDLDMFRFFLFSSNTYTAQLTSMLSEAIHLNKTDHIEVLTKAGGLPSLDDFVRKAGTNLMGVEKVVEAIMKTTLWTPAQLNDALDAAVTSGSPATIETLFEGGAQFTDKALVNVSKRLDDPLIKRSDTMTPAEQIQLLNTILQSLNTSVFRELDKCVPKTVAYVFMKHEWSQRQITDAMSSALEAGSFETIQFLKEKGGTFRSDALIAAVRRARDTKEVVKFVRRSRKWSVDQLSDALHQAVVICRPNIIVYLNTEGAVFNDSSLKNVLLWHCEHHIQVKFIKYILRVRTWSQELFIEAFHFACETKSLAVLALIKGAEESRLEGVLMLREIDQLEGNFQILKNEGRQDDLALVLNKEIQQGCEDVVEHLICKLNIPCGDDSLSNAMDNSQNYQRYDRLKMVRLVHESRHWSDESLMKALDKALKLGYTEVVFYLHDHGAMFSDQSLECAIMDKTGGYDIYALVTYLMKSHQYNKEQMNNALQKSLEIGHFQLLTMLCENGAEFADKSLQRVIHKKWKLSDRLPAVQLVLNAREWNADEKNEALLSAVKLGDAKVIRCILRCGGVVSRRCLLELLEKKCKPSHRLSIFRLLIPSSGSLSQDLLRDVRENAKLLSEPKLEAYIQKFIT